MGVACLSETPEPEMDPFMSRMINISTPLVMLLGCAIAYQLNSNFGIGWNKLFFLVVGMGIGLVLGILPQDGKGLTFYLVALGFFGFLVSEFGLMALVIGVLPCLYLGVGLRQMWLWRLYWDGKLPYRPYWRSSFKIAYRFI